MRHVFLATINHFDTAAIVEILNKNSIDFFFKNLHSSSIMAGWATPGSLFNEKTLFVDISKLELARELLATYIRLE